MGGGFFHFMPVFPGKMGGKNGWGNGPKRPIINAGSEKTRHLFYRNLSAGRYKPLILFIISLTV